MTDCPNGDMRDLLPDLLHGRLSPEERREVEAHVGACADCGAELALLRELRASMARVPTMDVTRIVAALPAYRAPARRAWIGWRIAAAVVVIVAGGTSVTLVQRGLGSRPSPTPSSPPADIVAQARPVAVRELALASSATSDLSDRELKVLLSDIESLDALPSADVENAAAISPAAPPPQGGGGEGGGSE